jgi:hypothetical protein
MRPLSAIDDDPVHDGRRHRLYHDLGQAKQGLGHCISPGAPTDGKLREAAEHS